MLGERLGPGPDVIGEDFRKTEPTHKEQETRELFKTLNPERVKDRDGIERTIYTFQDKHGNPVRALFYGREELPMGDEILSDRDVRVFGTEAKWRTKEDREEFTDAIEQQHTPGEQAINPGVINRETLAKGNTLILVEQNPRALLDFAITMGADQPEIRDLRKVAASSRANDQLENIVDQVIAGKMIDDNGEIKTEPDAEGEALLVLSLNGNAEAQTLLEQKRAGMAAIDQKRELSLQKELQERAEKSKDEALKPQELVAVHVTKYVPLSTPDKKAWELQTTYEATNKKIPRVTQHFTLNHAITSAGLYGSWNESMAVLMPLDKMVETNGKPAMLNTVDTFWEVSPGRRIELPKSEARLVKPGAIKKPGQLFEKRGPLITYKDSNLTPEDVKLLVGQLKDKGVYLPGKVREIFAQALITREHGWGRSRPLIPEQDFYKVAKVFGMQEPSGIAEWNITGSGEKGKRKDLLPDLQKRPIRKVVESVFEEAGIKERIGAETIERITTDIESDLTSEIRRLVIRQQIRDMGYEVHGGGMWAWDGDSFTATAQTEALGAQIGVRVGPHSAHESKTVEEFLIFRGSELQKKKKSSAEYRSSMRHMSEPEFFRTLSKPMRRTLYETGALA